MTNGLKTIETSMKAIDFTSEELTFIKDKYAPDSTEMEWKEFIALCQMHGASPMKKQIYFIKFKGKANIVFDFKFKLQKAMEAGTIKGFTKPTWYDKDGKAKVVWAADATKEQTAPFFAEIGVYLNGNDFPIPVTLYWSERCKYMNEWLKQPLHMMEKCLISKAADLYAAEVSGMHIYEEIVETPHAKWDDIEGTVPGRVKEVADSARDKQRAKAGDLTPADEVKIDAGDKSELKLAFKDMGIEDPSGGLSWINEVLKHADFPTVDKIAKITKGGFEALMIAAKQDVKDKLDAQNVPAENT